MTEKRSDYINSGRPLLGEWKAAMKPDVSYDVYKLNDRTHIDVAVAGYTRDQLRIFVQGDKLVIRGKGSVISSEVEFVVLDIYDDDFELEFLLDPHADIEDIKLQNGILSIILVVLAKAPEIDYTIN